MTLVKNYEPYGFLQSSAGSASSYYDFAGEYKDPGNFFFLRARYYSSTQGRFLSKDSSPADDVRPESFNGWLYTNGNPTNYTDPSGRSWQAPTGDEGTWIHQMIDADFVAWGDSAGKAVAYEVRVLAASKEATTLQNDPTGYRRLRRVPIPDIDDPELGKADLVDFTEPQVYEIKFIASSAIAVADAEWYQERRSRPWHLWSLASRDRIPNELWG